MGWSESPPFFCAHTETVADMVNQPEYHVDIPTNSPHHLYPKTQQEHLALPTHTHFHPDAVLLGQTTTPPTPYTDVYIDDFMVLVQRPHHEPLLNRLLYTIDAVFQDPPDSPRKQVVSVSKLDNGDATFSTYKCFLGWDIDSHRMTLQLLQRRLASLAELLTTFLGKQRTSKCRWQRLLGTLRSTTPALYGATHMFSLLQHALTTTTGPRIRITPLLKATLSDWLHLADTAANNPVPIHTLVPRQPDTLAATDASGDGMGGFWATPQANYLWRSPFPHSISAQLITASNPTGTLNNSDLELAAIITGSVLASRHAHSTHDNILLASDNTPAVAWATKGSTTTTKPPAYLLRHLAIQRRAQPFTLTPCFSPGNTNLVADCCSRLFHLNNMDFMTYMTHRFPTQPSWTLVTPPKDLLSVTNYALSKTLQPLASLPAVKMPLIQHGPSGTTSALVSAKIPSSQTSMTQSPSCRFLHNDTARAPWLPAGIQYMLEQWKEPFELWARRSPHWDSQIHACSHPEN
jgi:hypothetical protein